jgi:hypothetical protein
MTTASRPEGRRSRGPLVIGLLVTALVVAPMVLGAYLGVRRASREATAREAGSPAGTWVIEAGPVADGDSSVVEVAGQANRFWGRWVRAGSQPIVPLGQMQFDGHELTTTAVMGAGPARMRFTLAPDGHFSGEWVRGTERIAFRGVRRGTAVSADMLAAAQVEALEPGIISTDSGESFSTFAPGGQELFFTVHQANFSGHHIVVTRFADGAWSPRQTVPFSGTYNDREPRLSPDGGRLFFSSNRPVAPDTVRRRDLDLWFVERAADGHWSEPQHLPSPVNSAAQDFCPVVTATGTLYFVSTREDRAGQAGQASQAGQAGERSHYIWRSRMVSGQFEAPERLDETVSIGFETNVFVTADESLLLASRDGAPDSKGGDDLYVSMRRNGAWQPMRHLGGPVNTWAYEYGPTLSADGRWLYFTSDRRGSSDLYRVEAKSVGVVK